MTRLGRHRQVFFVEPPVFDAATNSERMEIRAITSTIRLAVPHLHPGSEERTTAAQRHLLDELISRNRVGRFVLWYWTSTSAVHTRHLALEVVISDFVDERHDGSNATSKVHPFPGSVDAGRFMRARVLASEPADQAEIPRPRLGCLSLVDDVIDLDLVEGVARRRQGWHWIFMGPARALASQSLPRAANIHYLGSKPYEDLPDYLGGWDVAAMPLSRGAPVRFLAPTMMAEYLAAGCPVVSTTIQAVRPYGDLDLVDLADTVDGFVTAAEAALRENRTRRLARVDRLLADASWDAAVRDIDAVITATITRNRQSDERRRDVTPAA
jgi:UDP-galactopyranose mutase